MDPKDVKCPWKWDMERLGNLAGHLKQRGAKISVPVIQNITPDLSKLGLVSGLVTSLYHRHVIIKDELNHLSHPQATRDTLTTTLIIASHESYGRGKHIVESLYLSLLDVFLDQCNQSCHDIAMNVLRENAVRELGLSPQLSIGQEIDLRSIATVISQIRLPSSTASELRQNLNLDRSNSGSDMQSMLIESRSSLCDIVRAMMITRGVGRYTVKLLPFHQSYPVEVFLFLNKLGKHWVEFAQFLGFSVDEVETLQSMSCHVTEDEIRNFSKVWRMPDLKSRNNDEVLYHVLQVANISLDDVLCPPPSDSPNVIHVQISTSNGRLSTQVSQESPVVLWMDRSLSEGCHPHMRDLRSTQGSGSSEFSPIDSDIHPLVRQQSQMSAVNDVDVSLSTPVHSPYQSAPVSPHPTSSEPLQASEPGSDPKQHLLLEQERYVVCSKTHASSVNDTEQSSSVQVQTPTFEPGDQISPPSRSLGIGLYGEILEVDYKGKKYAAKEYRSGFISPEELKTIFAEKLIDLRHPNVVPYYGVCNIMGTDRYVVVMERVETNLASFIDTATRKEKREIEPQKKLSILHDVAKGLEYLHSLKPIIVHCDLKPRNVLLTAELTAKIADCGNCCVKPISIIEPRQEDSLYFDYLPPEATSGDECSDKQDVFAFSHLSLYLIIQSEPHPLANQTYSENGELKPRSELVRRQKYITIATEKIGKCTNVLYPLLEITQQCLDNKAANRPPISEIRWRLNKQLEMETIKQYIHA